MSRTLRAMLSLAAFAVLFGLGASPAAAAAPSPASTATAATPATPPPASDRHEQMKAMHEQLMGRLDAMDAKIDGLVAAMNAARGDAKVDATAAVVTELVAQRKE